MNQSANQQFMWETQAAASSWLNNQISQFGDSTGKFLQIIQSQLQDKTGTRLTDWLDFIRVCDTSNDQLRELGFEQDTSAENVWRHPGGIFPTVLIGSTQTLGIKVDSVDDYVARNHGESDFQVTGDSHSQIRLATMKIGEQEFVAVERHGFNGFDIEKARSVETTKELELFTNRPRNSQDEAADFAVAIELFKSVSQTVGRDWACDLFFQAERNYWMSRNKAARIQKARQDQLGLGWANHDHHTYRCSREHFARIVHALETMGFVCREQFYAGEQAGWGAQVLEHPTCGIVIFADVDMTPEEVTGDFAHQGLPARRELGTVGLWCKLHGEAFLSAGMHHLECQFDFDRCRSQLADEGINTMKPFTDFPFLRQAFTEGEVWQIPQARLESLVDAGSITSEQAESFSQNGAIGSHLEILERNDGYKGFNQTGISDIIQKTDPRRFAK